MYRFLLTPRWLVVGVLVLLAVPFCVFMGSWQLSRFQSRVDAHKDAKHTEVRTAGEAPVPLASLLPDTRAQLPSDASGRPVTATGRFDSSRQLLVPDRVLDGRNGYYVLTPLRLDSGAALPVVRGWLPGDVPPAAARAAVPAAPAGEVTVTGALQYAETVGSNGVPAAPGALPTGQLGIISAATLVNVLPYPVYSSWITATHATAPLKPVPPVAPPGSGLDLKAFQNLGYTGEWFVFAGFVVFMYFRLARREAEARTDAALGLLSLPDQDPGRDPDPSNAPDPGRDPEPGNDPDPESVPDSAAAADKSAESAAHVA
ncbi:SURF1 family protein [Actinacidiphila paucisporea]|uniref:SURF1-like protein n=1 Tax=Actinacidiphila paucisporea TaxID=310782 RepID=A0A1M6ZHR0_9ACTN|nr:SURF1 family protein [Actinacidiphila paucisporea]SHL29970.1 Cytochrome oxidase assembly protein ShyY1 [Actinacidiphila paucisporea]